MTRKGQTYHEVKASPAGAAQVLLGVWSWAIALALFLIPIRGQIMGYDWYWVRHPGTMGLMVLAGAYHDLLYVAVVAAAFGLLLSLLRASRWRWIVALGYWAMMVVSLLLGLSNIQMVRMLGRPINYEWLYYSGFLRGFDAKQAIIANLSWSVVLGGGAAVGGLVMTALLLRWGLYACLVRRAWGQPLAWAAVIAAVCYAPFSYWKIHKWDIETLENPVLSLATSMLWHAPPYAFIAPRIAGPEDFQVASERPAPAPSTAPFAPAVSNVVVVVLESVPAMYLPAYGEKYPVTPELDRYRGQRRLYNNIYSHVPNSNKAMVSLLCSIYPWPSYRFVTQDYPDAGVTAISEALKQKGYRTGLFYAADLRFGGAEAFLGLHQFDAVKDYRAVTRDKPTFATSDRYYQNLDGADDSSMGQAMVRWIDADAGRPFFALLWTMQTHYPYCTVGPESQRDSDSGMFNRYLSALRESDRAIGNILRALEQKGLLDSTLVVVLGDHGEAFAQHGQYTHGSRIYEENIHIPLMLINSRLFKGEEDAVVGGEIDIAPTILDLLRIPAPGGWQGQSLFSIARCPRTYFLAPWTSWMVGYREGNRKVIFHATNRPSEVDDPACYEVYDLGSDPHETKNLAVQLAPEQLRQAHQRLAGWVQYQDRLIQKVTASSARKKLARLSSTLAPSN